MTESFPQLTPAARRFMDENEIDTVTFQLVETRVGCCVGIVKEIEPVYEAPSDTSEYDYYTLEDRHVFVARRIRRVGPIQLKTEGFFKKRLALTGALVPLLKDLALTHPFNRSLPCLGP